MEIKNQVFAAIFFLCYFLMDAPLSADDKAVTMLPECCTFYAGREQAFTIKTEGVTGENLSWRIHYSGRTLAAGTGVIPATGKFKIKINFPELKEGVVAEMQFSCWIGTRGKERHERGLIRKLFIYHPNPFAAEKDALKKLKIGVWEPGEVEGLSKLFESLELPFSKVSDPSAFEGKVLLVSGLDFDDRPNAAEMLFKLLEGGKRIIVIPPVSGTFPLISDKFSELRLEKKSIISRFNKKFDIKTWNGKEITGKGFKLISYEDGIGLEIKKDNQGFTCCMLSKAKGGLILTTWDIVNGSKESPTPIYLLKEILLQKDLKIFSNQLIKGEIKC